MLCFDQFGLVIQSAKISYLLIVVIIAEHMAASLFDSQILKVMLLCSGNQPTDRSEEGPLTKLRPRSLISRLEFEVAVVLPVAVLAPLRTYGTRYRKFRKTVRHAEPRQGVNEVERIASIFHGLVRLISNVPT